MNLFDIKSVMKFFGSARIRIVLADKSDSAFFYSSFFGLCPICENFLPCHQLRFLVATPLNFRCQNLWIQLYQKCWKICILNTEILHWQYKWMLRMWTLLFVSLILVIFDHESCSLTSSTFEVVTGRPQNRITVVLWIKALIRNIQ